MPGVQGTLEYFIERSRINNLTCTKTTLDTEDERFLPPYSLKVASIPRCRSSGPNLGPNTLVQVAVKYSERQGTSFVFFSRFFLNTLFLLTQREGSSEGMPRLVRGLVPAKLSTGLVEPLPGCRGLTLPGSKITCCPRRPALGPWGPCSLSPVARRPKDDLPFRTN